VSLLLILESRMCRWRSSTRLTKPPWPNSSQDLNPLILHHLLLLLFMFPDFTLRITPSLPPFCETCMSSRLNAGFSLFLPAAGQSTALCSCSSGPGRRTPGSLSQTMAHSSLPDRFLPPALTPKSAPLLTGFPLRSQGDHQCLCHAGHIGCSPQ